jgi:2-keto-4-pentenoate hydratase/2-oxohepta-3-ene-1,7-dioic acid hydratase in catechol pathway
VRLVTYDGDEGPRAGLLVDDSVVPVAGAEDVGALLRAGPLEQVEAEGEPRPLGEVRLLPPVLRPGKIVCIGLNYHAHAAEGGREAPESPTIFAKFANALVGAGAEVALPGFSRRVDYEAEVAFVIGRRCKDVAEADALEVVAGYTLLNDLSARDYQFKTPQWMPGKVFDGSAPCGPALVTPDEAGAHDAIEISLDLNGERMQHGSTADLIHPVPALVAYLSELMTLEPGDIVSTGTPEGVGSLRDPKVWLKAGDEVVISSPTLGRLETRLS